MRFSDSPAWRTLRVAHLSAHPWCVECAELGYQTPAEHVDHVVPIRKDWARRLDPTNLQSLCQTCHSVKTQTEDRGGIKRGTRADGMPRSPDHPWNQ